MKDELPPKNEAVHAETEEEICGVPGCSAPAFITVRRCAIHTDNVIPVPSMKDLKVYNRYIWKEYQRHIKAATQLLKKIDDAHKFEASRLADELAPDAPARALLLAGKLQAATLDELARLTKRKR